MRLACGCAAGLVRRVARSGVVALALTGCGSVGTTPNDRIAIRTAPEGAEVKASSGESCSTPCSLQLGQGVELAVVISKRGFKTERLEVGENCTSTVDIALRPVASITAFELPDRDLPLIANCGKRATGRSAPSALAPVH